MLSQTRLPKSTPHQNAKFSPFCTQECVDGKPVRGGWGAVCPLVTPVDKMWHGAKYFMAVHSGARNWKWIPSERSHLHETQSLQIRSCNLPHFDTEETKNWKNRDESDPACFIKDIYIKTKQITLHWYKGLLGQRKHVNSAFGVKLLIMFFNAHHWL